MVKHLPLFVINYFKIMCGIYGLVIKDKTRINSKIVLSSLKKLALLSQSRGKDSSGICLYDSQTNIFNIVKGAISASSLFKRKKTKNLLCDSFIRKDSLKLFFGHARLVTNGSQLVSENNQPVISDGMICVHNGIIVNHQEIFENEKDIKKNFDIDTEVIPAFLRNELSKGISLSNSLRNLYAKIEGTASIAIAFDDVNEFCLATNNGSLYVMYNDSILFFASEYHMLNQLKKVNKLDTYFSNLNIIKIDSNKFCKINLNSFEICFDDLLFTTINQDLSSDKELKKNNSQICIYDEKPTKSQISTVIDLNKIHLHDKSKFEQDLLIYDQKKIKKLKRCSKCILPETFPFIQFDNHNVCNYCRNYVHKQRPQSLDELRSLVEPYRSKNNSVDCIIPFSGGRDSMYVLHIVKKELGLNPIAFTYDWGMVTDLARRNIARICGKLGVENIIVAADIHQKRIFIKKNIEAWLKRPELGMIPLFMAGDKFFFHYASKVKKQTGVDLNIWGINDLENTDFKTGFGGIKPQFNKEKIYSLSILNQIKLFSYVSKNVALNPKYLNASVLDSLGSFATRYISPKKDYYHLFDYLLWDEKLIENTIINEYNWEKSVDTTSTWRIGDGTASFYNYIYVLAAGFSENDTFRSNQIRQGMISREDALKNIYEENKPRYNSIKWYLSIIGLDFDTVIKRVNKIERLF